jgi:hypothetical protein
MFFSSSSQMSMVNNQVVDERNITTEYDGNSGQIYGHNNGNHFSRKFDKLDDLLSFRSENESLLDRLNNKLLLPRFPTDSKKSHSSSKKRRKGSTSSSSKKKKKRLKL